MTWMESSVWRKLALSQQVDLDGPGDLCLVLTLEERGINKPLDIVTLSTDQGEHEITIPGRAALHARTCAPEGASTTGMPYCSASATRCEEKWLDEKPEDGASVEPAAG